MTSQDTLTARYGAPAPWRRRALIGAIALVVATFLSWLAWSTLGHANPPVASELVTFDVLDDHTVSAVVQVDLDEDAEGASCLLRAFAEDHAVVGELRFIPEVASGRRYEQTIRTERLATSVESIGCTVDGIARPR